MPSTKKIGFKKKRFGFPLVPNRENIKRKDRKESLIESVNFNFLFSNHVIYQYISRLRHKLNSASLLDFIGRYEFYKLKTGTEEYFLHFPRQQESVLYHRTRKKDLCLYLWLYRPNDVVWYIQDNILHPHR